MISDRVGLRVASIQSVFVQRDKHQPGNAGSNAADWGDRRSYVLLFCFFSLFYAYFFQGGGWNQNSYFDTVRAIVERGTMDITAYARNTGDAATFNGRVYENKLPGLPLVGAPVYFILYHLERHLGISPHSSRTATANAHVLTFFTSGLPGVLLLLVLYQNFRRRDATVYESLWLTGAFGIGSLLLPYSGVMMSHLLTACLLFTAWHLISAPTLSRGKGLAAGLLAGMAAITDLLAAPVAVLFLAYLYAGRKRGAILPFVAGAGLFAGILAAHDYHYFGSVLLSNQAIQPDTFKTPGYLFGMFTWPTPTLLYWLTLHPYRGLFYGCPVVALSLFSLHRPFRIGLRTSIPLLVFSYYLIFNMSFNGWTGGWGVGPRYLIPSLAFLYSLSLDGFRRWPRMARLLMVISAVFMISATAVEVMVPGPNGGPPPPSSPITDSIGQLASGEVSVSSQSMLDYLPAHSPHEEWDSYNLGELLGLSGLFSLAPIAIAMLVFWFFVHRARPRFSAEAPETGRTAKRARSRGISRATRSQRRGNFSS